MKHDRGGTTWVNVPIARLAVGHLQLALFTRLALVAFMCVWSHFDTKLHPCCTHQYSFVSGALQQLVALFVP